MGFANRLRSFVCFTTVLVSSLGSAQNAPAPQYPALPSETPSKFELRNDFFNYTKREVKIPMRDGVKLHTVIVIPKGAKNAPILLTRTPYSADVLLGHAHSPNLSRILYGYDNATDVIVEGGYIRVVQDIRGKYESEGDYVMNRPLRGPLNPTPVDHSTDTYDTIDWLVTNIPESNGRVGILGISYDGFTTLMALFNPHPALKVAVPMNPMVDGWMGDDWFHNGAFRQQNLPYIFEQQATRKNEVHWASGFHDDYDQYMSAGSAGELARRHGLEQVGFWRKILEHPTYDSFWQQQAVDKLLGANGISIPTMLVHGLWDQEDIYGAPAVYNAVKPKDKNNNLFLVFGPWNHGQQILKADHLGDVKFDTDTALYFRKNILAPFLAKYLKDAPPAADIAPVYAFETGTNTWRRLQSWPAGCESGCPVKQTRLYLASNSKLSFQAPIGDASNFDEYVSDPAKPVPYRTRPVPAVGYTTEGKVWSNWLVDDQREFSGRPDVLTYVSDPLTSPMKIAGTPIANLVASTSGTDSDWVVKLIDVYPTEVASDVEMGGYQLGVSMDIFRGRYRESFEHPKALTPNQPLQYRFALPNADHVFLPGHRIMVQVQSTWFPLYDRNPQTFVENIFWAKPTDYRKATQRVFHSTTQQSFIELPVTELK